MTDHLIGESPHGAGLLAALDAILASQSGAGLAVENRLGMLAASEFDRLLAAHGVAWDDVTAAGSRFAKLCGRLGSAYEGERQAAYDMAVRQLRSERSTWSRAVRLTPALAAALAPPRVATAAPCELASPDGDWSLTVRQLLERAAWRSTLERTRLENASAHLALGAPLDAAETRLIRDIWWHAELNAMLQPEEERHWPDVE